MVGGHRHGAGNSAKVPTGFLLPTKSDRLYDLMNTWLEQKIMNGQVAVAYDRWRLGKGVTARKPSWSLIRKVLHWVDSVALTMPEGGLIIEA